MKVIRRMITVLVAVAALPIQAQTVSRQAPKLYQDLIEPWLTPVDEVLAKGDTLAATTEESSGAILLQERFVYVFPDGRRLTASHWVMRARTEAGVSQLTKDVYSYRRQSQRIHVVLGQTIQPDGTRVPVRENALILQTPQSEASRNLYSDQGELTMIFPDVKSGSITETIVVVEDDEPRVPNEFMMHRVWGSVWPKTRLREAVELSGDMARRLVLTPRQEAAQPRHSVTLLGDGRVRHRWELEDLKPQLYEYNAPSAGVTGPSLWMTTWAGWDDLAQWYDGLLQGRDGLSPELADLVDEWTAKANSREEVLTVLTAKAANEVRYTGLEFGLASLQPYHCNEVWKNGYGDCKDKANLLKAMLQHKGISAYIALLDTEDTGQLIAESPDYRQFNHAILAVPNHEGGGYVFIDPTVRHSRPGILPLGDLNRDVVIIRGKEVDRTRTPLQSAGTIQYRFDLKLDRDGSLAGWMYLSADRYYACSFGRYFSEQDQDELERANAGLVRQWYPNADAVDFKAPVLPGDELHFETAIFFVCKGTANDAQDLTFPEIGGFLPACEAETRRRDLMLWHDDYELEFKVVIPEGFTADSLPASYSVEAPHFAASGHWKADAETRTLTAELSVSVEQGLIPADQYPVLRQAITSFISWAGQRIALVPGNEAPERRVQGAGEALADFPLMPTGKGQLALVDARYPEDGNMTLRRKALERTIQLFPNDSATLLIANTSIAYLDYLTDETQGAVDRLRQSLMNTPKRSVDAEEYAWSEYLLGMCLAELGETEEAVRLFDGLSEDETLSVYRRGWAYWRAGMALAPSNSAASLTRIEAGLLLDSQAKPSLYTLLAEILIAAGRQDELADRLTALIEAAGGEAQNDAVTVIDALFDSAEEEGNVQGEALLAVLSGLAAPEGMKAGEKLKTKLDALRAARTDLEISKRIQQEIRAFFEAHRPAYWDAVKAEKKMEFRDDYILARDAAIEANQRELAAKMALRLLLEVEAGEFFGHDLWQAAVYVNWVAYGKGYAEEDPWIEQFFVWAETLPVGSDSWHELLFFKGVVAERMGKIGIEVATLTRLAEHPELKEAYSASAYYRCGKALEKLGRNDEALGYYKKLEGEFEIVQACSAMVRQMYLYLRRGEIKGALRILDFLEKASDEVLGQADGTDAARELMRLRREGDIRAYFARAENWKGAWEKIVTKAGAEPPSKPPSPIIDDYLTLNKTLENYAKEQNGRRFCEAIQILLDSAQWLPSDATHACYLLYQFGGQAIPAQVTDVKRLVALLADDFPEFDIAEKRTAAFYGTAALMDLGEYEEALAMVRPALAKGEDLLTNTRVHTLARLYGLIALELAVERSTAAALLEQQLNEGHVQDARGKSVEILAKIYDKQGESEKAAALLQKEIGHPVIERDEATRAQLAALLEQMTSAEQKRSDFTAAVRDWKAAFGPPWLEFAEPRSADDPRLKNLRETLDRVESYFSDAEIVKFCLLALEDEEQSELMRSRLVGMLLFHYAAIMRDRLELLRAVDAVIQDARFSIEARVRALSLAIMTAEQIGRWEESEAYRAHPVFAQLSESFRDGLRPTAFVEKIKEAKLGRRVAVFRRYLRRNGFRNWCQDEAGWLLDRLVAGGFFDEAKDLAEVVGDSRMTDGKHNFHLKLDLLRRVRDGRERHPLNEALKAEVFKFIPEGSIEKPEGFDRMLGLPGPDMPSSEVVTYLLYNVKSARLVIDEDFWGLLLANYREAAGEEASEPVFRMFKICLEHVDEDAERAEWIHRFSGMFDLDDPEERERFMAMVEPYRNVAGAPFSRGAIRLIDYRIALRLGEPIDVDDYLDGNAWKTVEMEGLYCRLRYYLARQDMTKLREIVTTSDVEQLLSAPALQYTLRAYTLLGFQDELEVARARAKEVYYEEILEGWVLSPGDNLYGVSLILPLRDWVPDLPSLPPAWEDHVASIGNDMQRLKIQLALAVHEQSWDEVATLAKALIERYPTYYDNYWDAGEACYHLNRAEDAREYLTVYTKYAKDELNYPKALELLEELNP